MVSTEAFVSGFLRPKGTHNCPFDEDLECQKRLNAGVNVNGGFARMEQTGGLNNI
jgi:hypothetical protein